MDDIKVPSLISNILKDIAILVAAVRNIKFVYRNRFVCKLADPIAKRPINVMSKLFSFINDNFFCLFQKGI